jgi:hypothetical protein
MIVCPFAGPWQPREDVARLDGVVEYQQPSQVRAAQRSHDGVRCGPVVPAGRQAEHGCQRGELSQNQRRAFGGQPGDQVVAVEASVDVLAGELGLADATEAVQRLDRDQGPSHVQVRFHLKEEVLASDEVGVSVGYRPDNSGGAGRSPYNRPRRQGTQAVHESRAR